MTVALATAFVSSVDLVFIVNVITVYVTKRRVVCAYVHCSQQSFANQSSSFC